MFSLIFSLMHPILFPLPLQMRSVNDVENVLLVGEEVFRDFHGGNLLQLVNEISGVLNIVLFL